MLGPEEFEEIGFLTMRLAGLEEMISLWCEALLIRPEFNGFLTASKPVFTKQFSEKLTLLRMLIKAAGTLYDIQIGNVETSLVAMKEAGEDRNTIIHGLLAEGSAGVAAFRTRGREVEATLSGLRALTKRFQESTSEATTHFAAFYRELIEKEIDSYRCRGGDGDSVPILAEVACVVIHDKNGHHGGTQGASR